jgi:3-methyladenine DNA glycosylase AlkD
MAPTAQEILEKLKAQANPGNVEGMARYGINPQNTLGVPMPVLRGMAREIKRDHPLALKLWDSGLHEARILAGLIADPGQVDEQLMERWVHDFDSWDVCDQVCSNLFDRTPFAYSKAVEWSSRQPEFVKRAGFVLMAALAVHDKKAPDSAFEPFFPLILREAADGRNFVKKAVNWALRGLGKRNRVLNARAIQTAQDIALMDSKTARWVAAGAVRELTSESIQTRLAGR